MLIILHTYCVVLLMQFVGNNVIVGLNIMLLES